MTPFKVIYGREPPTIIPCSTRDDIPYEVHDQLVQRDRLLAQLKLQLSHAQARMKTNVDKKRTKVEFNVGVSFCEVTTLSPIVSTTSTKSKVVHVIFWAF